ncbi:MAG: alpha/beta hydrolase [Acidobacteria bacterium]|nr:alpha/beta hydrolase [Acidobacteriota bacterium]
MMLRRTFYLAALSFVFASSWSVQVHAQATTKAAQNTPPPPTPAPLTHKTATTTVEVGTLDGVPYRIDLPDKWNRGLVVYFHGYTHAPVHFREDAPELAKLRHVIRSGYAVVQSAYAQAGWALQSAPGDTEKLRKYFGKKFGQPKETFVTGESMGGALVMMTIERNPKPYAGGLNLCGSVGSTLDNMTRRFALRAAFDYYFPGLLPKLDPVPSNFVETEALRQKVIAALNGKPAAADAMRNLVGLPSNIEVARMMVYYTYIIADFQHKAGGNPFENRNTIYTGTSSDLKSDAALNDGVMRYSADPKARKYLLDYYEANGKVTRPVVALHTLYDPIVPGSILTPYQQTVAKAGHSANYVQQYVPRQGHCSMTADDIGRAFDELVTWVHTGKAPAPGLLR